MTYDSWRFHDMAQGVLSIPLWIPQIGYSGGLLILAIALVDELVHVLKGNKPTYEKEPPSSPDELVERIALVGPAVHDIGLVNLSLILLGVLIVVLSSGVWIAVVLGLLGSSRWRYDQRTDRLGAGNDRVERKRFVDACGATVVHLDGEDSVPHTSVGGNVSRPRPVAAMAARSAGPCERYRLRYFRRRIGLVRCTCATIGKIALPELEKRGYDKGISLALWQAPARLAC